MAKQEHAPPPRTPSAASRIADGIVEAGWIAALAVTPVFFDIQSGRPFEPDKTAVLRLLAIAMATAALVRAVEDRRSGASGPPGRWRDVPLVVGAVVYVAAAALSTVLSIQPSLSFWGSHTRLEGLLTLLAHVTVFACVATRLRRRAQADRLLATVIASSVPVCLYAFVQRLGRDPLDWQQLTFQEWRVATTLGNPVFAGEYLLLALLVTLGAALWWWRRRAEPRGRWRPMLAAGAAVLQLAALGLTGSRGPWLGAAAAVGTLVLLFAALQGRRRLATAALAAGAAAVVFVGVLNVPNGPLERLRRGGPFARLGHIYEDSENRSAGDQGRVLTWRGALKLARLPQPIAVPGRGPDALAGLRGLVGFGPETLAGVFGQVYDPAFAAAERLNPDMSAEGASTFFVRVPDRSHNELLDSLVFGGLLGVLAHLLLHASAFFTGLRGLGLAGARPERVRLAAFAMGGLVAAVGLGVSVLSWAYVGVLAPLGLVAGLLAFVLAAALSGRVRDASPDAPLLAALTAALAGAFVSMQFGPTVVTGRLHFWALAGLLAAAIRFGPDEEPLDRPELPWDAARAGLPALALGLTIAFGFAGLKASGGGQPAWGVIVGFSAATIAMAIALTARDVRSALYAGAGAGLLTAAFALAHVHALQQTALVRSLAELVASLSGHFTRIAVALVAVTLALGVALAREAGRRLDPGAAVRLAIALAVVLALAVPATIANVNADVLRHFGATFQAQGRLAEAAGLYEEATRLAPGEPLHRKALGEALLASTRQRETPARLLELLTRAEAAFTRARALDPLAADNTANLARLHRRRSELATDPAAARREAETAAAIFAEAQALVPANTLLLDEMAELDYQRLGDFAAAEAKLGRSLELDPTYEYTHIALGDLYLARARAHGSREDLVRAEQAYAKGLAARRSLKAIVSLGLVHKELGDTDGAIAAFEEALAEPPPPSAVWPLHEQLAGLYAVKGDAERAQDHARNALIHAPERERAALEARLRAAHLLAGS